LEERQTSISVIIAGALVAVAVLITGHWQIGTAPTQVYRVNRWTGSVTACNVVLDQGNEGMRKPGNNIPCE
jgi:hypothetical protein